jgi:hypothetical protein
MRVLEGPAVAGPTAATGAPGSQDLTAAELAAIVGAVAAVDIDQDAEPDAVARPADEAAEPAADGAESASTADEPDGAAPEGVAPEPATAPEPETEPEPEPVAILPRALDRPLPDGISAEELERRAEAAMDAADPADAVERLLDLASAYRIAGTRDAAMDACYVALSLDPDHVGLHLALVELYDDNGWAVLAGEKLDLLDRLVTLGEDAEGAGRVASARAVRA